MNRLNKLIAIILSVAVVNLPTDVFALRPAAHKDCYSQYRQTTQHHQSKISPTKPEVKRSSTLKKSLLSALFLLPVVLFLNHIICEYMLSPSASLHELSKGLIIRHFSISLLVLSMFSWVLYQYNKMKKINGFSLIATISMIYGISLQSFDIIKYHGVWNYISTPSYLMSPGDVFIYSGIFLTYIGLLTRHKRATDKSVASIEKINDDKNEDPIARDLRLENNSNESRHVVSACKKQIRLPDASNSL